MKLESELSEGGRGGWKVNFLKFSFSNHNDGESELSEGGAGSWKVNFLKGGPEPRAPAVGVGGCHSAPGVWVLGGGLDLCGRALISILTIKRPLGQ